MWSFFSRDPTKDFAYEVGEKVSGLEDRSLWILHQGKRKSNGEAVSVFVFDIKSSSETVVQVAKASFKRLKTLRHPNILTFIDGLESDRALYIVTESVIPLSSYLDNNDPHSPSIQLAVSWGLHQVAKSLSFLNFDCNLVHNNVNVTSVFVDRAGEWKLGGVDFMYPASGPESIPPIKMFPLLEKYDPPERSGASGKRPSEKWSTDMWSLGCLIWEVFNGCFTKNTSLKSPGKIPKSLMTMYCGLVGANPRSRPSPSQFIESCRSSGGFMNNQFVTTMLFLNEIQIQDQEAKNNFFNNLPSSLDLFPTSFCKLSILPQLINAFEYGNAGSAVLAPLFKLGKLLDTDEYQQRIVPCVVKLFSSTDRSTRVKLLQQIEVFVEHLSPPVVNSQIFPNIVSGFMDSNPVVREHTIKSMIYIASKLNYKNLNEEVLKHFARLQSRDDQGGIRTNTTVCLGKIACHLNPQIRQRVLSSAYMRAMKDPFPPARQAGILAMAATHNYFTLAESAQKLLPALCYLTTDPDKGVRDQAFRTIKCFLGKLEKVSENPELSVEAEKDVNAGGVASSSAAGWTNWAVSGMTSLTSKIYRGKRDAQQRPAKISVTSTDAVTEGSQTPAKEVSKPEVSSAVGQQTSAPGDIADVTRYQADNDAEESSDADGWDDAWDDEEKWGDMAMSGGYDDGRNSETETAAGDGWDDADNWESFEVTPQKSSAKSTTSWATSKSSAAASFDTNEFESVRDNTVTLASSYNWDQTAQPATSLDPNSDEFFNSMLADDTKKSSKSSILKAAGTKLSTQSNSAAGSTANSRRTAARPDGTTASRVPSSRTTSKDKNKQKSTEDWDDSSWGDQW